MRNILKAAKQRFTTHIYTRILCICLLLSVVPLILLNQFWLYNVRAYSTDYATANAQQLLNQTIRYIENSLNVLDTLILSLVLDEKVNNIVRHPSESSMQENQELLTDKLLSVKSLNDSIAAATIISRDMVYAVSTAGDSLDYDRLFQEEWYQDFVRSGASTMVTGIHESGYLINTNMPSYTILRRFTTDRSGLRTGYIIVEVYATGIIGFLTNLSVEGSSILLYDRNGRICYATGEEEVVRHAMESQTAGEGTLYGVNDAHYLVIRESVTRSEWLIALALSKSVLFRDADTFQRRSVILFLCTLIVILMAANLLSRHIVRPTLALSCAANKVRSGDLSIQIPVTTNDEVGRMSDDFNAMIRYIRELVYNISMADQAKFNAEVKALQAQINPHFLYNTLNVIRWLSMMHENEKIDRMVVALVRLLEFSREGNEVFIPISRELEHVRYYSEVMALRYEEKYELKEDIDDEVLPLYTIRFILQPLVENAIFHGIDPLERRGTVCISIHLDGGFVYFGVQDDGVGIDRQNRQSRFFSGMGITNVNERLTLQLGADYGLQFESSAGRGTRVYFHIPVLKAPPRGQANGQPFPGDSPGRIG